jgi:hypothetical protein
VITYVFCQAQRFLREALTSVTTPQVSTNRTRYVVYVDGTLHHVRRDRVCDCGGTPQSPCPALPLIQDYLAAGGPRPLGCHESTWPEAWTTIPSLCPACDCPTVADRYLNSSHGPGWRCTFDASHYWWVRLNPLRRYLITHPPPSTYPWCDTTPARHQAWIEDHYQPPRCLPDPLTLEVTR